MKQQSLLSFFSAKGTPKDVDDNTKKRKENIPQEKKTNNDNLLSSTLQIPTLTEKDVPLAATKRARLDTPKKNENVNETLQNDSMDIDSDDAPLAPSRKPSRIKRKSIVSESSDEEWNPEPVKEPVSSDSEEDDAPILKKPHQLFKTPTKSNASTSNKLIFTPQSSNKKEIPEKSSGNLGVGYHIHDSLPWINENRRDKNGNKPESSDYDERTLFVPNDFLKMETPAMKQWWEIKSENMDTVLFFKVGKFYELFHMDADVGFKELGLIYMKGDKAHSGFPEIAYGKMSSQLVQKGYRVARVEQTETPEMMKSRNNTQKVKSKVVQREICSLLSIGTNTNSFLDGIDKTNEDGSIKSGNMLLSIKEVIGSDGCPCFGICSVDCSRSKFQIGEFIDSKQRDRLRTLLAQSDYAEIISEKGCLSEDTNKILKFDLPSIVRSQLIAGKEFWDAKKTLLILKSDQYFDNVIIPDIIEQYENNNKALALSALGGCVWYLNRCKIDKELIGLCNFEEYQPVDIANKQNEIKKNEELNQEFVVLDTHTITNLELIRNSNGKKEGSLLNIMDRTVTPFGKRLFREWLLRPLSRISEIKKRIHAVEDFMKQQDVMVEIRQRLQKLPDLEQLISRIYALGSTHRATDHPDSRAVMYEDAIYNKRKIKFLLSALDGFRSSIQLIEMIQEYKAEWNSPYLKALVSIEGKDHGKFPKLEKKLVFFQTAFDQQKAKKDGKIIPQKGADSDYDNACNDIEKIIDKLNEYLQEQRKILKCSTIEYWGSKKEERYQLEVPEGKLRNQPDEYELKSKKKGFKRYHTPTINILLKKLIQAEERKDNALTDQMRRVFYKFSESFTDWSKAVKCLSALDCLVSLALFSSSSECYIRPEFETVKDEIQPYIDIKDGKHPCVMNTFNDDEFIPNDISLGTDNSPTMLLLSGPNMGGKSTLLRQTCLIVLMAQMGCYVPASYCKITPVDRIFTRLGASDRIMSGQSTFFVELSETATILNFASKNSLVILDELGRGTSTFDGTAIAYSVVEHLVHKIGCRTMFATHYHSLVEEYLYDPRVSLGHMDCFVDDEKEEKVTFLYKLVEGMCPKSYGINVARLAKLPEQVIHRAKEKSEHFEQELLGSSHTGNQAVKLFESIQHCCKQTVVDVEELRSLWQQVANMKLSA